MITERRDVALKFPDKSNLQARLRERGITDPAAVDLIQQLLTLDPRNRINASQAAVGSCGV